MAVTFVASSAVATGTNPTVSLPAGVIEKDLLLLITTGTAAPTTPAGWTQRSAQGANGFITVLFKFATGTEAASQAVTLAGTTSKAVMLAYRGASAIDTVSGFTTAVGTSLAPGLTGNAFANELEISVYAGNNAVGAWGAAPSPTTSRVSSDPTAAVNGLLIVDETQAAAGNSTARTGTISTSHTLSSVAIAIIPSGRYWRGGTGTWTTTTTNWSFSSGGLGGAPAPTAQDPVFFDQAATYTVTLTGALTCLDMTVSAGTVTFSSTGTITSSGSMSLIAGTVWSATGLVTFNSTSTGRTVTTNSVTINSPLTFNGVGGVWSLGSAVTTGATLTTTLTSGTLALNGFDLTTGIFSSSAATTRSITFGTNNIVLAHTTAATVVLSMAIATGFTYTGTGGFTATAAVTRTFTFGTTDGTATNAPNLSLTLSGTAVQTFTTASWFNNLNFGTTAFNPGTTALNIDGDLTLSSGGTFTTLSVTMVGTGTITTAGKTIAAFVVNNGAGTVTLSGALGATTYTQTAGAVDFGSNNLSCSGAVAYTAGTLTNIATITCTTWTVTGAFTLSQGTITPSTSFVLTSGSFTYSGGTLSPVPTFTHTAGTVSIGQNYSLTSTGTYTLVAGTLTLNDHSLTAAAFITSGTGTRQIDFGTSGYGEITVTGNNVTVWDGGGAGITYTGNPRIVANYTGATGTRTVNLGTAWTEATAFDVQMQPASYPFIYGFQIINGSTDIIALAGVADNVSLTGFLFTLNLGVMTVYGDYNIDATGGTVSSSANTTTFASTNASARTITISRTVDFPITFSGVGGTFNLGATLTTGSTRTMTLTAGTLVLNGNSVSTGIFSSTGTGTRAINFGGNFIALSSLTAATTVLSMADATNFTVSGAGGFNSIMAVAKTFVFGTTGGSATNAPNLFINAGSGIPTITTNSWFNTLNFTGSTSTPAATTVFVSTLTLATGGTYTALTPIFTSTQTWTPQFSKQLAGLGFNLAGGTLTLGGSQSLIATATTTLTAGTLDLNGNDLTTGIFSSSNTNTRSIVFGSNNINLTHTTAAQTVLAMATATGFTYTGTGGFVSNTSVTRTFQFGSTAGGSATNAPNLAITSGALVPSITTNSWFNALNFTGTTATPSAPTVFVSTLTLATGGTYTGLTPIFTRTQTWTTQFSKQLGGIGFNLAGGTLTLGDSPSLVATGTTTLTAGTLDLGGFNLTTGIFSSNNANTRSIVFGTNNIILSHTTAAQSVLAMATATGFTYTGTGGFTTDASVTRTCVFGTTGGSTANAPNLSLTGAGVAIVTLTTGSWFDNLSFGSTAFALAATTLTIVGDLTLSSGGTFTSLTLNMVGTGTILSNAKTILALTINNVSGTTTLGDSLTLGATAATTLTSGNLALNGFTLTTGTFSSSNTNTRSIAFGSGNIVLATTTAAAVNLVMNDATNFTYTTSGTFGSGTGCFQSTMSTTRTFTFGTTSASGTAANAPILYLVSGASVPTITTGGWFREINFGTTAFTIAATNLNLTNVANGSSTSVLTALTSTMVATGTIYAVNSIGPVVVNTAGITTSFQNLATSRCTTLTVTQGTVFLDSNAVLICSSTCTLNTAGTLDMNGQIQCTTFTIAGATYSVSSTCSWIISTSVVITSGTLNINYSPAGGLGATPTFTHTAGTVNVNTSYALTATGTYTFTAGTLNINDGVTLSTGIFSSTNTNTRTINFGITTSPGYIALTHTTAATVVLSMANVTGLTVTAKGKWDGTTAGPAQVAGGFRSETTVTRTFTVGTTGGNSDNAPCLYVTGTGATQLPTFTTGSWFGDFSIYNLSTMTIAATSLNINSLYGAGYYFSLNTTSMSISFRGSGFIAYEGDTNNTFGILGAVTINHSGTTSMVYNVCAATSVAFTAGTLECRYWVNGGFTGYGQFKLTGAFTQTGGTWYNNAVYIANCTTYTINGATVNFDSGLITATTSFVSTSGSFTFNGGTLSAVPTFTHTNGTVTFNYNYSLAVTGTYTLTAGTLTLARGSILNTGIFSSTGSGTRSIGFGASIATQSGSAALDGTNQYLSMSSSTAFDMSTSSFTVEGWIYLTAYPAGGITNGALFGTVNGSTSGYYLNPGQDIDTLRVTSNASGAWQDDITVTAGNGVPLNTWTHLAMVRNGDSLVLYKNGVSVASRTGVSSWNYSSTATNSGYVGYSNDGSTVRYVTGYISNVRVVKGVAVYTGNFTVPASPLTATQSAGTNISAITGTQTSLLLNTAYGTGFLTDSSTYNAAITNAGAVTSAKISPYRSNINLTHTTAATTVLSMATATGFTLTGTGGFTVADMANTRTFNFGATAGGSVTNAPSLTFTTGASVATLTTASWFDNLDFGTTSFNPGTTTLNIAGDLTLSSTGTYTTLTPTMVGTGTIISNTNTTLAALVINSTSGTTSLGDTFSLSATGTTTLTSGTLAMNRFNLTTGIFSSSGAVTRSIAFGGLTAASSASFDGSTQYASYAINSNIKVAANQPFTVEFWIYTPTQVQSAPAVFGTSNDGGQTGDTAFFVGHSGLGITNQYGFYCNGLTNGIGGSGTTANLLASTGNYITNTWTHIAIVRAGTDAITMYINGVVNATAIYSGAINFPTDTLWVGTSGNNFPGSDYTGYISNFRWVTDVAVYTGNFAVPNSPLTATQSSGTNISSITGTQTSILLNTVTGANILVDSSSNNYTATNVGSVAGIFYNPFTGYINLAHTTAATTVLSMATVTGFTVSGTGGFTATASITRTYTFGTTGGSATISPNLTLTGTGTAIATITTASWFNTLDFGSTAFAIAATALNLNGLTLSTSGTFTNLTPTMVGTGTITANGKTLPTLIVNTTGTATLAGALTLSGALTLTQGTLACLTYAVTSATFASTGTATRSMTGSGTYTISGAGATAFSNASATGITIVGLIISMTAATAKTFAGGGGSYSTLNQGGAGALTISGDNSFSDLTATTRPSTITFTASSTQTFADFTLSGVLGSLVTINSSAPGTQTTLSKASGTVSVGYLSIRDSIATGGAGWYAGTTSTNVSNNLGWIFTAPPAPGSVYLGNFFAFF